MIFKEAKILITGASGLVGTALKEELKRTGYENIVALTRDQCDLTDFSIVKELFKRTKPDIVFHMAASVYGIGGNIKNRGSIFLNNILINTHVIEASHLIGAKKVIAMGTVASYPVSAALPAKEEHIWNGPPHNSEGSYGHAKRAMLAQLEAYHENYGLDFAYVISTNLYGPYDKFDVQHGHVIPSLIRKFYEAKLNHTTPRVWGDGSAARDFLYSKDMARALVLIMNNHSGAINVASGQKTMIKEVVRVLSDFFGIEDKIEWDARMPNGREYQSLDLTRLNSLSFKPQYSLESALQETAEWFVSHQKTLEKVGV